MLHAGEIVFGPFCLTPAARRLECDGHPVELGSRAFDLLVALAERPGEVLSKRELLSTVWQDAAVDEGALRFAIAMLRRALAKAWIGPELIRTVPWRGYCFVVPDQQDVGVTGTSGPGRRAVRRPLSVTGRATDVQHVITALSAHRFVTITGPGGIGKTTVALAALHLFPQETAEDAFVVDLSSIEPDQIAGALAMELNLIKSADPLRDVVQKLRQTSAVVLLDGCEHVVDAAAVVAERIHEECPDCFVLTTSREALRSRGERNIHLRPLAYPESEDALSAAEARAYSAVQLFCERVSEGWGEFELTDEEAPHAASICRRLNGVPLALELAAARVPTWGTKTVASLLEQSVQLDWRGRRTAPLRQMTLSATLEWSYQLLTADEQILLRLLSAFVGTFDLRVVERLPDKLIERPDLGPQLLEALIAKSLVTVNLAGAAVSYQLLDMTMTFARQKMMDAEGWPLACEWHAECVLRMLELRTLDLGGWRRSNAEERDSSLLGDVRAALEWVFNAGPDHSELAIRLATEAATVFLPLFLFDEAERWAARALALLQAAGVPPSVEMHLQAAYGVSLLHQQRQPGGAIERGLALAAELGEQIFYHQLIGRSVALEHSIEGPTYALDRAIAARQRLSRDDDPELWAFASTTIANAYTVRGDHWKSVEHATAASAALERLSEADLSSIGRDARRMAKNVLCVGNWYIGRPGTAYRLARETLLQTTSRSDWLDCHWALMPLLWMRVLSDVEDVVDHVLKLQRNASPNNNFGIIDICKGMIAVERGAGVDGRQHLWTLIRGTPMHSPPVRLIAAVNIAASSIADGDVDAAAEAIQIGTVLSCQLRGMLETEVLRLKAEVRAAMQPDDAEAPLLIKAARDAAERRNSPSLALRVAMSAVKVAQDVAGERRAVSDLHTIYDGFQEGFDTWDLKSAAAMLQASADRGGLEEGPGRGGGAVRRHRGRRGLAGAA